MSFVFAYPVVRTFVLVFLQLPAVFSDVPLLVPTNSACEVPLWALLWLFDLFQALKSFATAVSASFRSAAWLWVVFIPRALLDGLG